MTWDVIKVQEYTSISDYNYLANQFSGAIIGCGYRDGLMGEIYEDLKYRTFVRNFYNYKDRLRLGYSFRSTAATPEEARDDLEWFFLTILDLREEYDTDYENDFPYILHLDWNDMGFKARTAEMTVDYDAILDMFGTVKSELGINLCLYIDRNLYDDHIAGHDRFYDYLCISQENLKPTEDIVAWEYIKNKSLTLTEVGIDIATYYEDIAGFDHIKSQDIGDYINALDNYDYDYQYGDKIKPEPLNPYNLEQGTDYVLIYTNNSNVGNATILVEGNGRFTGTSIIHFNIVRIKFDGIQSLDHYSYVYNGNAHKPTPVVKNLLGEVLTKDVDYTVSYENNTNAGTATCVATGKGNYLDRSTMDFEITPIPFDVSIEVPISTFVYTGEMIEPDVIVTHPIYGRLVKNTHYRLSYENNIAVGNAKIDITGIGNYTGFEQRGFTIVEDDISSRVHGLVEDTFVFCKEIVLGVPDTDLIEGTDYTLAYEDPTSVNVGTYGVTVKGIGNLVGEVSFEYSIVPAQLPYVDWTVFPSAFIYDGYPKTPSVYCSPEEDLLFGRDFELSYENNINVGTGRVILDGLGNYEGSEQITLYFKITASSIDPAYFHLEETEFTFDATPKTPKVIPNGSELVEGRDFIVSYRDNYHAGDGVVEITGIGNQTGHATLYFTIHSVEISEIAYIDCGAPVKYNMVYDNDNFSVKMFSGGTLSMYDDYYYRFETIVYPVNSSYTYTTWIVTGMRDYHGTMEKGFVTTRDGFNPDVPEKYRPKASSLDDLDEDDGSSTSSDTPDEYSEEEEYEKDTYERTHISMDDYDGDYDDKGNHIWHPENYVVDPVPAPAYDPYVDPEASDDTWDLDFGDIDDPNYDPPDPSEDPGPYWNFGDLDNPGETTDPTNTDYDFGDAEDYQEWFVDDNTVYYSGMPLTLADAQYYSSPQNFYGEEETKSGQHYIYNYKIYGGRIRITDKPENVNIPGRSSGWIKVDVVTQPIKFRIGDKVRVIKWIYLTPEGESSGKIDKEDEIMYIVDILPPVDFEFGEEGVTPEYMIDPNSYDFGDIDPEPEPPVPPEPEPEPEPEPDPEEEPVEDEDSNTGDEEDPSGEDESGDDPSGEDEGGDDPDPSGDDEGGDDPEPDPEPDPDPEPEPEPEPDPDPEPEPPEPEIEYDFNVLSTQIDEDNLGYLIALANKKNQSPVGFVNSTMIIKMVK